MKQINIEDLGKVGELANRIGINQKELKRIICSNVATKQERRLAMGPWPHYPGGYYGTISVKDV